MYEGVFNLKPRQSPRQAYKQSQALDATTAHNEQLARRQKVAADKDEHTQRAEQAWRAANTPEEKAQFRKEFKYEAMKQDDFLANLNAKKLEGISTIYGIYSTAENQQGLDGINEMLVAQGMTPVEDNYAELPKTLKELSEFEKLSKYTNRARQGLAAASKSGASPEVIANWTDKVLVAEMEEENYRKGVERADEDARNESKRVEAQSRITQHESDNLGEPEAGGTLVDLIKDDKRMTLRQSDPNVDELIGDGWTRAPMQKQDVPPFQEEQQPRTPVDFKDAKTLYEMADWMTGPSSTISDWIAAPVALGGGGVPEEVIEARQSVELAHQSLIRSLALNDKYGIKEQERIIAAVDLKPAFWDDPSLLRVRMKAIDSFLDIEIQQADANAVDKGLPEEARAVYRIRSVAMQNFREQLGVPQGGLTAAERAEKAILQKRIRDRK